MDAQSTRYVCLCKIGANESLFHANEDCQRNQKLLVWLKASHRLCKTIESRGAPFSYLFQLLESSWKQFNAGNFLCRDWASSSFTVSRQRIHEQGDDQYGYCNTCQIDGRDFEDFRVWRSLQVGVVCCFDYAKVSAAKIECRVRLIATMATARAMGTRR